ncbi:hypothetical protein Pcinc_021496 [Petrolisthes cinctipes]|uniref:Uncharacterized protein n=1 Tax=Petrolisthes cinctipes TaxID=88211 RepID=A0AAE1FH59_PETCI|nr:hypothetical protein Pcinc_021496 [Petrolisthes cinctipes]
MELKRLVQNLPLVNDLAPNVVADVSQAVKGVVESAVEAYGGESYTEERGTWAEVLTKGKKRKMKNQQKNLLIIESSDNSKATDKKDEVTLGKSRCEGVVRGGREKSERGGGKKGWEKRKRRRGEKGEKQVGRDGEKGEREEGGRKAREGERKGWGKGQRRREEGMEKRERREKREGVKREEDGGKG